MDACEELGAEGRVRRDSTLPAIAELLQTIAPVQGGIPMPACAYPESVTDTIAVAEPPDACS